MFEVIRHDTFVSEVLEADTPVLLLYMGPLLGPDERVEVLAAAASVRGRGVKLAVADESCRGWLTRWGAEAAFAPVALLFSRGSARAQTSDMSLRVLKRLVRKGQEHLLAQTEAELQAAS